VPAAELAEILAVKRPYPGLRPFEENEAFLFFGRQIHTDELLKRLSAGRFLAVVGTSGSGKSSLVRAGLLPALHRGFLAGATSRWRIAIMRPGNAPLDNLAKSLAEAKVGTPNVQELVRRSSQGFAESIRQTQLAPGESVLVVVDQFEELFRFERERRSQDGGAEASLFVSALLEASEAFGVSIYVVITMRSDFLGDCTQFPGLAEALNTSQYLIPRLTREQRREAIERPLQIVGANMTPRLVQRLLNDLGDAQDQLPVLQHALNRTFSKWKEAGSVSDIDFEHYEAAGELKGALDRHADDILNELPPDQQEWVERVFRCLTMFESGRAIRRPARFDRLCSVAGAETEAQRRAVAGVINSYGHPDNSLLVFSTSTSIGGTSAEVAPDTIIDISHESLIRNWKRLLQWLLVERDAVDWYRDVAEDVRLLARKEAATWRDPKLEKALSFLAAASWNAAWAERNQLNSTASFDAVKAFLKASSEEQTAERQEKTARQQKAIDDARVLAESERKARRWVTIASALILLTLVGLGVIYYLREESNHLAEQRHDLEEQQKNTKALLDSEHSRAEAAVKNLDSQIKQIDDLKKVLERVQRESGLSAQRAANLNAELLKLQKTQEAVSSQRDLAIKQAEQIYKNPKGVAAR